MCSAYDLCQTRSEIFFRNFEDLRMLKLAGICFAGLIATAPLSAQTTAAAPPQRPNCSAAEFRQLDFWVGEWRGVQAGDHSEGGISPMRPGVGDCAMQEG